MATRIGDETRARIAAAWPDLIAAVADGANIGVVCAAAGVTRDQVRVYRLENPECNKEWDLAREQSAEAFADQAQEIANNPGPDSRAARVRLQALMWLAAKRNPRAYSEKQQIDMNVRTVDLTRVIADARKRLEASRVIEGAVIRPAIANKSELDITSGSAPALSDLL